MEMIKMKAPIAIKMYAACSITAGSTKSCDGGDRKINTPFSMLSLTFKICFASSSSAWLTGLFECAVRLRVRLE